MESEIYKHIAEERLEAYSANLLDGHDLANVEEHLLFCASCQDQLERVEHYVQAMRNAAMRLRMEQTKSPAPSSVGQRLRLLLRVPIPVWCGALAMAVCLLVVNLEVTRRPGLPVDVELQAVRGDSAAVVPSGRSLRLHLDNQGIQELTGWQIEIVNSEGSKLWSGNGTWSDTAITAVVPRTFTAGTYYVRILKPKEDPVREYQLVVK